MPANAGIHGGERRNWRSGARVRARRWIPAFAGMTGGARRGSGARGRAKALDPRFRGDDRRDASSVSGPPPWQLRHRIHIIYTANECYISV